MFPVVKTLYSDILRFADLLIGNKVRVSEEFGISEFELRWSEVKRTCNFKTKRDFQAYQTSKSFQIYPQKIKQLRSMRYF